MLASAAQFIPEFGGDRKTFADWDFKLKAVAYDLGLDDLLLRPQEWHASHPALQQRVERAGSHAKALSAFTPCGLTFCIRLWACVLRHVHSVHKVAGSNPRRPLKCQLSFLGNLFPRVVVSQLLNSRAWLLCGC